MTFSFETSKKRTKHFPKKLVLWKFYCFVAHGYEHDEKRKKKFVRTTYPATKLLLS